MESRDGRGEASGAREPQGKPEIQNPEQGQVPAQGEMIGPQRTKKIAPAMNRDVRRYVDSVPTDRRPLFDELQSLILGMYPNAEVVISYQIPTYRAKSGWVGLGYWKEGVSLYTNGPHHIAEFQAKYPGIKTGKGSINLKTSDRVPLAALKKVVRHAIEHPGDR
jgi:uncharacterized protein YdhG (YjbR/CyaY superfamily)